MKKNEKNKTLFQHTRSIVMVDLWKNIILRVF